jgi:hypothetical protein
MRRALLASKTGNGFARWATHSFTMREAERIETMNAIITRTALSLSLFAASVAASAPANAQTHRRQHVIVRPAPVMPYGAHYGSDGVLYSSMGSAIPGYVLSQPNECWLEDGYSHWTTCNAD